MLKPGVAVRALTITLLLLISIISPLTSSSSGNLTKEEVPSHFNMSLSELLDIEIVSASKQREPAGIAPSTITVINEEQINRYGFRLLQGALKYVPSVYLYDPHSWVCGGQRGLVSNFSQTLLLVNGREVNNCLRGFYQPPVWNA